MVSPMNYVASVRRVGKMWVNRAFTEPEPLGHVVLWIILLTLDGATVGNIYSDDGPRMNLTSSGGESMVHTTLTGCFIFTVIAFLSLAAFLLPVSPDNVFAPAIFQGSVKTAIALKLVSLFLIASHSGNNMDWLVVAICTMAVKLYIISIVERIDQLRIALHAQSMPVESGSASTENVALTVSA